MRREQFLGRLADLDRKQVDKVLWADSYDVTTRRRPTASTSVADCAEACRFG